MTPIIIDADTGHTLWRVAECAAHCGIKPSTWTTYTAQQRTPPPVGHLDSRTPLWDAEQVKNWHTQRPGSPVPHAPRPTPPH